MSKILSYLTLVSTFTGAVLMGIAAGIFPGQMNNLYLCLAAVGIFLLTLRFNVFAIRNNRTHMLIVENNAFILVSLYMMLHFINLLVEMPPALYFSLLGVLGAYFIFIIVLFIRRRVLRGGYRG
ncbi:MAG: hypothetical protein HFJ84_09530 [Clostridiales bacterium]|nr:hypothetical protein [Clostridiales bacterium]